MLRKIREQAAAQSQAQNRANDYRNLIRKEAFIGGQLFGAVPKNRRRSFFCLDEHTWVWHEDWLNAGGQSQSLTTRYVVRPSGVLKTQDNRNYQTLSVNEAKNLRDAIRLYYTKVMRDLYRQPV